MQLPRAVLQERPTRARDVRCEEVHQAVHAVRVHVEGGHFVVAAAYGNFDRAVCLVWGEPEANQRVLFMPAVIAYDVAGELEEIPALALLPAFAAAQG